MKLKKISQLKLNRILKRHQKWLNSGSNRGRQADLKYTDLSGMDLKGAYLHGFSLQKAALQGAKFQDADLEGVCLQEAKLPDADLQNAHLWNTDFMVADLHGANLQGADLSDANLSCVNLKGANLRGANLKEANLWGADLQNVNLQEANLRSANLQQANLKDAKLQEAELNWANWNESENIRTYVAGLKYGCENAQLIYIPSIDVATIGPWQGTWQATIKRIHSVYSEDTRERKAYDLAIESIQKQMDLDDVEMLGTTRDKEHYSAKEKELNENQRIN